MPNLILMHARVHSLDGAFTTAEAVAVKEGRIIAVGTNDAVLNLARPGTVVHHLNGAALLPGFHDAHCHVLNYGLALGMVPLASPQVGSLADVVQRLTERASQSNGGDAWIRGRGYDQNTLAERRHPTRHDLDSLPGNPFVLITHASGHGVVVNSRVLRLAGITRATPDPPGGTIARDAGGEPTGVLLENAISLAYEAAPPANRADKAAALGRATFALNAMGITSATDAGTGLADVAVYREAAANGLLTARCTLMPLIQQLSREGSDFPAPDELRQGGDDWVRIGPTKIFSDGALTTRTARLRAPFRDQADNLGTAIWEEEQLNALVWRAHRAGWQIAIHAIGDGAIDLCLDAFGKALARRPRPGSRHRIEHAMLLWPDQVGRMARLGILPVYQPEFIARFGDVYVEALGHARAARLMPYRETQDAGLPLIFSSDLPVVPGHPLDGVAAAVRRRTPAGAVLDAAQSVGVLAALRAYTAGGAYSIFQEQDRGTITVGQRADLVVLSADPTALPPDEWPTAVAVRATLVGGNVVSGSL